MIEEAEEMKDKIPGLLAIQVGAHSDHHYQGQEARSGGFTHALDATFASVEALQLYATHPAHLDCIKNYIRPVTQAGAAPPLVVLDWVIPSDEGKGKPVMISTDKAPKAIGPYSQAIRAGNTLYVSGSIGMDAKGELKSGIEEQTKQSLENLKAIIQAAGGKLSDVVKVTVLLKSMSDYATVNGIYAKYFTHQPPARAAFAVAGLPKDALVEIECVAHLPSTLKSSL